jgi:adenylate cyclase
LLGAAALAVALGLQQLGALQALELSVYDRMLGARAASAAPDPRVVLVGATDEDLDRWGWPLSDEVLASVIERLAAGQPRAIGIDLYRDAPRPPGEQRLSRVLGAHPHVIAVMKLGDAGERSIPAPAALRDPARVGFADVAVDPGGTVRRGLLFLDDGRTVYSSLALRLALKYLEPSGVKLRPDPADAALMRIGEATVAPLERDDGGYVDLDAGGYQFLLDFQGGPAGLRRVSLSAALAGELPADALRERIVIVGVTAQSVKDFFHVPPGTGAGGGDRAFGIEFHGHAASQLLRMAEGSSRPMRSFSERQEIAWLVLWCALGGIAGFGIRAPAWLALTGIGGAVAIAATSRAAFGAGWWLPMMPALAGWLLSLALLVAWRGWLERRERGQLMQLFSRHVSPEVAATIWTRRREILEGSRLRPQSLTATVLFSDIKGFTSVSEKLAAGALVEWLNNYMERMAGLVMRHGGVVDKFIGDAVMAVFGVPFARTTAGEVTRDAVSAVDCALAMRAELDAINREHDASGLPRIEIRIGIFTGPLIVGSLGSRERLDYTVIGDTVNTAARLESYRGDDPRLDAGACRILIGESTLVLAVDRYEVWRVGELRLKGKDQGVTVFGVSGFSGSRREAQP